MSELQKKFLQQLFSVIDLKSSSVVEYNDSTVSVNCNIMV